jgi:hypothetical protein
MRAGDTKTRNDGKRDNGNNNSQRGPIWNCKCGWFNVGEAAACVCCLSLFERCKLSDDPQSIDYSASIECRRIIQQVRRRLDVYLSNADNTYRTHLDDYERLFADWFAIDPNFPKVALFGKHAVPLLHYVAIEHGRPDCAWKIVERIDDIGFTASAGTAGCDLLTSIQLAIPCFQNASSGLTAPPPNVKAYPAAVFAGLRNLSADNNRTRPWIYPGTPTPHQVDYASLYSTWIDFIAVLVDKQLAWNVQKDLQIRNRNTDSKSAADRKATTSVAAAAAAAAVAAPALPPPIPPSVAAVPPTVAAVPPTVAAVPPTVVVVPPSAAVPPPPAAVKSPSTAVKSPSTAVKSPPTAVKSPPTAVKSPPTAVKSPSTAVPSSAAVPSLSAAGPPSSAASTDQPQPSAATTTGVSVQTAPAATATATTTATDSKKWTCGTCTLENDMFVEGCIACGGRLGRPQTPNDIRQYRNHLHRSSPSSSIGAWSDDDNAGYYATPPQPSLVDIFAAAPAGFIACSQCRKHIRIVDYNIHMQAYHQPSVDDYLDGFGPY